MTGEPPSPAGAVQLTTAEPTPAVAVPMTGAPGTVTGAVGVTSSERADSGPVPSVLIAATENVYAVPPARPVNPALVASPATPWVRAFPPPAGTARTT